jgi:cytochrome b561/polyisoprenoid-binding protein YceI
MNNARYHSFSQLLHWLIAGLIVLQFVLANLADGASESGSAIRELALLANHKSVGITVLALVVVRLFWRIKTPPPNLPATMDQWQALASHISHWTLYGLIIFLPISGWLMSSASAYSVSWFNLFQLPDFVAPNPDLKELFEGIHEFLGKALLVVALIHVLAAIKHQVIDKDGVLARMSSTVSIGIFAVVIATGIWTLGGAGKTSESGDTTVAASPIAEKQTSAAITESATDGSRLPAWKIDYENSHIRFTGDQAGAAFDGIWKSWSANLYFDDKALDASTFDVTVYTTEVETDDVDRNVTLADPEWFDVRQFPEAYFRASSFVQLDDGGFVANGRLTIKDVASPIELHFTVEENGAERLLVGSAEMLRMALGVGTGEWGDTSWVSDEVTVNVRVQATIE